MNQIDEAKDRLERIPLDEVGFVKEDQDQSGGALVPSASSALTRKSTRLVRRGLDDLLKKRTPLRPATTPGNIFEDSGKKRRSQPMHTTVWEWSLFFTR